MVQYSSDGIVIAPSSTVVTIADISVSTTVTQLASNSAKEVVVKNIGDSNMRIGDNKITATRGDQLEPGESRIYSVTNSNVLYHRTESGSSTISVVVLN
jgi:hypothetical protein